MLMRDVLKIYICRENILVFKITVVIGEGLILKE